MCNPIELAYLAVAQRAGVAPLVASFVGSALREHAMRQRDRGSVAGFSAAGLAAWSGMITKAEVEKVIEAMAAEGLIDDGKIEGIPPRAMTSTERSRRRRERLRAEAATAGNGASLHNVASVAGGAEQVNPLPQHDPGTAAPLPTRLREDISIDLTKRVKLMPREGVSGGAVDNSDGPTMPELPRSAIIRERWLDSRLREAELTLPSARYVALLEAIPVKDRQNFIERKVRLSLRARSELEMLDKRIKAIRAATGVQPTLPLPLTQVGGSTDYQPPPLYQPPPEMFDYRGEDAELLTAVGD